MPEGDTFSVVVVFNGTATNTTAGNNATLSSIQAIRMRPLWHRVTFFYVRLLESGSGCQFASGVSEQHSEWPAPCQRDEYLSVLNRGWYVPGSSSSNPSSSIRPADFFNFIHQRSGV